MQDSLFWTTDGAGDGVAPYTQAQVTAWMNRMFCNDITTQGIVPDYPKSGPKELAPTAGSGVIYISPGSALVAGFPYESTETETITIAQPVLGTTGGRIVLRADYSTREVRLALLMSNDGVAVIPPLIQNANAIWDIPLVRFTITTAGVITLTDERVLLTHNTNHVRRAGDAMTGTLTAPTVIASSGANPTVRLRNTSSAANSQYWQWVVSASTMALQAVNDAYTAFVTALSISRDGTTVTQVDFPSGGDTVRSGGNPILHTGNMALRVVTAWIADLAVTTGKLADGAVTMDKIANLAVATAKLANSAVTLAKTDFGPRRQGGNASNWSVAGTNNYTPATVFPQIGAVNVTLTGSPYWIEQSVTFPVAYFYAPLVLVSVTAKDTAYPGGPLATVNVSQATPTGMTFELRDTATTGTRMYTVTWLALGGKELI